MGCREQVEGGVGCVVPLLLTLDGVFDPVSWAAIPYHFFQFLQHLIVKHHEADVNFFAGIAAFVVYVCSLGFLWSAIQWILGRLFGRPDVEGEASTEMLVRWFGRRAEGDEKK